MCVYVLLFYYSNCSSAYAERQVPNVVVLVYLENKNAYLLSSVLSRRLNTEDVFRVKHVKNPPKQKNNVARNKHFKYSLRQILSKKSRLVKKDAW